MMDLTRYGSSAFLMVSGTLNRETDEIEKIRKRLGDHRSSSPSSLSFEERSTIVGRFAYLQETGNRIESENFIAAIARERHNDVFTN